MRITTGLLALLAGAPRAALEMILLLHRPLE
jgi:hypothetical protein